MSKKTRALTEAAIMVAMALVLELISLYKLPNGGSVTLSAVPIVFFAVRHGMGWGAMAGFVFGGLNYIMGGSAIDWTTIIFDYFLAFAMLGMGAGIFKGRKWGAHAGAIFGISLQFLASYLVGVFVWGCPVRYCSIFIRIHTALQRHRRPKRHRRHSNPHRWQGGIPP